MHPNPVFRNDDRALHEALVREIGFAAIFAVTPDGPRVAHAPLVLTEDGGARFHLACGNALTRHLAGADVLAVVTGPDAYVSPRWYADPNQVPTWNYVAIELEGRVRRLDRAALIDQLDALAAQNEARLEGPPWTRDKMAPADFERMLDMIVGFELEVRVRRPTFKLSQNKPASEREGVALGLQKAGSPAIAELIRTLAS